MDKIVFKCKNCGSPDIRRNCDALWDIEKQEWVICDWFDTYDCFGCGGECDVTEELVPESAEVEDPK